MGNNQGYFTLDEFNFILQSNLLCQIEPPQVVTTWLDISMNKLLLFERIIIKSCSFSTDTKLITQV